jgi:hypothetical protein
MHSRAGNPMIGRKLFWLLCPLAIAQLHSRAAAVLVDELFPAAAPTRIISQKDEIGFVLTQGTKIVNLQHDSARRS